MVDIEVPVRWASSDTDWRTTVAGSAKISSATTASFGVKLGSKLRR